MNSKLTAALVVYIGAIITANVMAAQLGQVGVGFGLVASWGTFAAGFALVARDFVQRYGGTHWRRVVVVAILVGTALSWLLTAVLTEANQYVDPTKLALASAVAFLGSELVDLEVFTRVRDRLGMVGAVAVSNVVSVPIDTVLFLWLSGFGLTWSAVGGQLVGKLVWATAVPLVLYVIARAAVEKRTPVAA